MSEQTDTEARDETYTRGIQALIQSIRAWSDGAQVPSMVIANFVSMIDTLTNTNRKIGDDADQALTVLTDAHLLYCMAAALQDAEKSNDLIVYRKAIELTEVVHQFPKAILHPLYKPVKAVIEMLETRSPDAEDVLTARGECVDNHVRFPEEKDPSVAPLTTCTLGVLTCVLMRCYSDLLTKMDEASMATRKVRGPDHFQVNDFGAYDAGDRLSIGRGDRELGWTDARTFAFWILACCAGKETEARDKAVLYHEVFMIQRALQKLLVDLGQEWPDQIKGDECANLKCGPPPPESVPFPTDAELAWEGEFTEDTSYAPGDIVIKGEYDPGFWKMGGDGVFKRLVAPCPNCGKFASSPIAWPTNGTPSEWMCPNAECDADEYTLHLSDLVVEQAGEAVDPIGELLESLTEYLELNATDYVAAQSVQKRVALRQRLRELVDAYNNS